jgi:hypothetical protein
VPFHTLFQLAKQISLSTLFLFNLKNSLPKFHPPLGGLIAKREAETEGGMEYGSKGESESYILRTA